MIQSFLETLQNIFKVPELRKKIGFTFLLLIVYRLGFKIPLPGVDPERLGELAEKMGGSGLGALFKLADLVSGGGFLSFTLFSLGIMPYISAAIIFQLLTKVIPKLEEISKEGATGRQKIEQYTKYATILICLIQGTMVVQHLAGQTRLGLVPNPTIGFHILAVLSLTTGAMFLIWLGKLIDDHGIGNGISIIIMAGIIARLPQSLGEVIEKVRVGELHYTAVVILLAAFVLTVVGVVFIQQGQRRIPVQQAKQTRGRRVYGGQRHFMPLRVNMAGVIPIIFASSLLIFPRMITPMLGRNNPLDQMFQLGGYFHVLFYVALTFFFCFFWNSLIFNPAEMANNMKEYGSFIPGIRPGKKTANYLERIITRITLAGAAFLAFIAVFPEVLFSLAQLGFVFFLGGTSLLIVVGVALDVVQKVESHLLMRHYKGFMGSGSGIRGRRT